MLALVEKKGENHGVRFKKPEMKVLVYSS